MKRDWLQICSNIAIVVGLIVVIYELNQNNHRVRAQLVMDDYANVLSHWSDLMGDDPAAAIAKAMQDPSMLTPSDRIIVDAHLRRAYTRLHSTMYFAEDLEIFTFWEDIARSAISEEFSYPYAREWWQRFRGTRQGWNEPLDRLVDEVMVEIKQEAFDDAQPDDEAASVP